MSRLADLALEGHGIARAVAAVVVRAIVAAGVLHLLVQVVLLQRPAHPQDLVAVASDPSVVAWVGRRQAAPL